jgi:hypothetical protein
MTRRQSRDAPEDESVELQQKNKKIYSMSEEMKTLSDQQPSVKVESNGLKEKKKEKKPFVNNLISSYSLSMRKGKKATKQESRKLKRKKKKLGSAERAMKK